MPCGLMAHLHITWVQEMLCTRFQNAAPLGIALLRVRKGLCFESSQALLKVLAAEAALAVLYLEYA